MRKLINHYWQQRFNYIKVIPLIDYDLLNTTFVFPQRGPIADLIELKEKIDVLATPKKTDVVPPKDPTIVSHNSKYIYTNQIYKIHITDSRSSINIYTDRKDY